MKLTKADKMLLADWGYPESSFEQIELAAQKRYTKYTMEGQDINREEAIKLLGRREFLSGLARSAFHFSAMRECPNGKGIVFDSIHLLTPAN